jgi:hypothetical protein
MLLVASALLIAAWAGQVSRIWWVPVVTTTLFVLSLDVFRAHAFVATEPLFLLLLSFWAVARYIETSRARDTLLAEGIIALAVMSRYAGIILPVIAGFAVVRMQPAGVKGRYRNGALLAALALLPILTWFARNYLPIRRENRLQDHCSRHTLQSNQFAGANRARHALLSGTLTPMWRGRALRDGSDSLN